MTNPLVGIKDLIAQVQSIAVALGTEPLDGISTVREYQDHILFISIDEATDRVWVAIPVADPETQEINWHPVLDVPEDGFPPEKFLTNIIPESGDLAWTDYLDALDRWIEANTKTVEAIAADRYLRKLIGNLCVDANTFVSDLVKLYRMHLYPADIMLKLLYRLLEVPADRRHDLLQIIGAV
jgi:hypothetical protein